MGLQFNITDRRKSEILPKYFTFPVELVGVFKLDKQEDLERFIDLHKKASSVVVRPIYSQLRQRYFG